MLIIKLNRNLEIYSNHNFLEFSLKPSETEILGLFKGFKEIWESKIWPKIETNTKILFIIGTKAGFTDARIISIWLNSLNLFNPEKSIVFAKYLEYDKNPDDTDYIQTNVDSILENLKWDKTINAQIYTREPSINQKI